jgi:hypothetical protein
VLTAGGGTKIAKPSRLRPREESRVLKLGERSNRGSSRVTASFLIGLMSCLRLTGPGSCHHRVPSRLPKHGTRTGPSRHGQGGLHAGPGLGRAKACRAMGCTSGRPGLDMYRLGYIVAWGELESQPSTRYVEVVTSMTIQHLVPTESPTKEIEQAIVAHRSMACTREHIPVVAA